MLPELKLDELVDNPVEWKLHYKRIVTTVYAAFSAEDKLDWCVTGNIEARVRLFHTYNNVGWKAQGVLYCKASQLVELWNDVNFERRAIWGDLFASPICETVIESKE